MLNNFKVIIFVPQINNIMKYSKDKDKTLGIRLDVELKRNYLKFIKDNGYSLSKRIRILLENDMKHGK